MNANQARLNSWFASCSNQSPVEHSEEDNMQFPQYVILLKEGLSTQSLTKDEEMNSAFTRLLIVMFLSLNSIFILHPSCPC